MTTRSIITGLKFAGLLLLASYCMLQTAACKREKIYDPTEYGQFKLVVKPRWIELEKRPTGMTLMIYPENGTPVKVLSQNVDSVVVDLQAGNYRILLFNQTEEEFSSLTFRHMESYADCEVIVADDKEHESSFSLLPKSKMCKQPEVFAEDHCDEISVTPREIDDAYFRGKKIVKTVVMKPHVIISTMYITVHVEGIYNAYAINGCIDGMSRQIYMTYFDTGKDLAAHFLENGNWKRNYESISSNFGTFTTKCTTMGLPGTSLYLTSTSTVETREENIHTKGGSGTDPKFKPEDIVLRMKVLLVDKKTVVDTLFLVGEKVQRRINEPLILDLDVPGLYLPYVKPEGSGEAAFDVIIDEWDEKEETIIF